MNMNQPPGGNQFPLFPQMNIKYEINPSEDIKNMRIRPIRMEDAYFMSELRTMEGIYENLPSIYSERVNFSQNFIQGLSLETDHMLVAESFTNNSIKILGIAGLHVNRNPRQRHCANINIMVHPAYHHRGIGKQLMNKLIDIADNWIMLKKIELEVVSDNIPAINLYKKYNFKEEGVKKYGVVKRGKYKDIILMARYNL